MKILLTVHDFLPSSRAGTELYTYYLAQELKRRGFMVELFFVEKNQERSVEHQTYEGLPCTIIRKPLKGFLNLFEEQDALVDRTFLECLERFQPDVVHINHLLHLSTNIPAIAHQHNVRVVFSLHDHWLKCPRVFLLDLNEHLCEKTTTTKCIRCCHEFYSQYQLYPPRSGIRGILDRSKSGVKICLSIAVEGYAAYRKMNRREKIMGSLIKYVDLWIAPSNFLREIMVAWGLPEQKVLFLPHGMPHTLSGRVRHIRQDEPLRFAYIGTISRHKGVHVLLEAFRGVDGANLAIYGRRHPDFYVNFGDVLAQGNVAIKGIVTDDEKPKVLSEVDALIVPSICIENAPLVIQEAFVMGVPVICSDIGGMKELVRDGQDGLHFRVGSSKDLRRVIEECIKNPSRLRSLQPVRQNILTTEDHVSKLIPLYRSLLES